MDSSLVMEASVNIRPPCGQRSSLFPTEETGLQRVGLLAERETTVCGNDVSEQCLI